MRRPTLTWLMIVLTSSIAACGTDHGTPTPSAPTPVAVGSSAPASASTGSVPPSRPASADPGVASPTPTASPVPTPVAWEVETHLPIVGFQNRIGVGSTVPVTLGLVIGQGGSDHLGPSTSVAIATSRNGGPFVAMAPTHTEVRSLANPGISGLGPYLADIPGNWWQTNRTLAPSGTYRFRARARVPGADAWSSWVLGPTISARALQETSPVFQYSAGWSRATGAALLGDGSEVASSSGAVATATVSARSIAWVALRRPEGGSAEVRIDGVLADTVSLYQTVWPNLTTPEIVFAQTWQETGTHTISITVVGTPGHPAVNIDELLVVT